MHCIFARVPPVESINPRKTPYVPAGWLGDRRLGLASEVRGALPVPLASEVRSAAQPEQLTAPWPARHHARPRRSIEPEPKMCVLDQRVDGWMDGRNRIMHCSGTATGIIQKSNQAAGRLVPVSQLPERRLHFRCCHQIRSDQIK